MNKYPVEMLDEYIRLQDVVNDHQIRCVINFESKLNLDQLKAAIIHSVEFVPLLSCQYSMINGHPVWEEVPFNINKAFFIESDSCAENHYEKYFSRIPLNGESQIVFQLVRQEHNDVLIINVNHMVFDGSGFKSYLYLLSELYSEARRQTTIASNVRSMHGLLRNIKPIHQFSSLFRKTLDTTKVDLFIQGGSETKVRLGVVKISASQAKKISEIGHQNQFTLNDFVLALLAHSLFHFENVKQQGVVNLQMMFDLRRYATRFPVSEYGNFSSMESLKIDKSELSLIETAKEIGRQTRLIKSNYPGVKNVILLNSLFKVSSIQRFDALVAKTIQSLGVSTSNLGVINDKALVFSGCVVASCSMFTSIKKQPGLQLSFSTFKGNISLSILGKYSKENWLVVSKILENIKESLLGVENEDQSTNLASM